MSDSIPSASSAPSPHFEPDRPKPIERSKIEAAIHLVQQNIFDLSNAEDEEPPKGRSRVVNAALLFLKVEEKCTEAEFQWAISELCSRQLLRLRTACKPSTDLFPPLPVRVMRRAFCVSLPLCDASAIFSPRSWRPYCTD